MAARFLLFFLLIVSTCYDVGGLQPTDLFTGFFPCAPNSVNMSTQEDAQNCDLFVYVAVQLALERVENELENDQKRLALSSIETGSNIGSNDIQVLFDLYVEVKEEFIEWRRSITRATIGTSSNYAVGKIATSMANFLDIPIISYGLADNRFNKYTNFYRTIPSTDILNRARIRLLDSFDWYRIGLLGSSDKLYNYQMRSFREFFSLYIRREMQAELVSEGSTNNLHISLESLHELDIRIILGFFGPEEARMVLCEASSEKYDLTTSDHVWILPSYYNPDWWKRRGSTFSSAQQSKNCTDERMADILQSVIFLDSVKYPPLGSPLAEFYPSLLNKTRELFPRLSPEVKLEPLLQHSRAVSAYDSTLLLSRSLIEGQINISKLHSQIVCELCRVYPKPFLHAEDFEFCQSVVSICQNSTVNKESLDLIPPVSREDILAAYGQVLISQFINGTHCPMVLFWPTRSSTPEELDKNYVPLPTLTNLSGQLGLDLDVQTMFPNSAVCPQYFYWKGRNSHPTSNKLLTGRIPVGALVFMGMLTVLGEVLIIFLIVFSIVWRENVRVKSTSPRVNAVMLLGAALHLPYTFMEGILLSSTIYKLPIPLGTALCQIKLWISTIGVTLLATGLLVKIIRLYRIFRNKRLRVKLKYLHDQDLIITALLLVAPTMIILTVLTAIPGARVRFFNDLKENDKLQLVQISTCKAKSPIVQNMFEEGYNIILAFYSVILLLVAFGLSLFVAGTPKPIKIDLLVTRFALMVASTAAIIASMRAFIERPLDIELRWWFQAVDIVFGTIILMSLLIGYQVVLVLGDYCRKVKQKKCSQKMCNAEKYPRNSRNKASDPNLYHDDLHENIDKHSHSLVKKEVDIIMVPENTAGNKS